MSGGLRPALSGALQFFDAAPVLAELAKTARQALSRFGAFVRQRAKTSMRPGKTSAPAGQPPAVHVGTLKRLLFFAWDPTARTVVVGPTRFGRGEAPGLNEYGGRSAAGKLYPARPYMAPALEKERAALPKAWADAAR